MKTNQSWLDFVTLAAGCLPAQAQWVRWDKILGGNDHWYKAVPNNNGVTPRQAAELARQDGGYLATITSAAENAFVFNLVNSPAFFISWNGAGPALGGRQQDGASEPDGGWYWVTGEPLNYTNWRPGQPDDNKHKENSLHFWSSIANTPAPTWNDQSFDDPNCGGYVVERDDEDLNQPPLISVQPTGRTAYVGETVLINIYTWGSLPLVHQWRKDGVPLDGETNTTLTLTNVSLTNTGDYTVVVTNAFGAVTSAVARVTVPSPARLSNLSYSPAMGFSFIFRDGTLGQHYRIQTSPSLAEGSWVDWLNVT